MNRISPEHIEGLHQRVADTYRDASDDFERVRLYFTCTLPSGEIVGDYIKEFCPCFLDHAELTSALMRMLENGDVGDAFGTYRFRISFGECPGEYEIDRAVSYSELRTVQVEAKTLPAVSED